MSTYNIPFSTKIISNLQLWDFSLGLKNKFETIVVNEPSVFEPLKFYCNNNNNNYKKIIKLLFTFVLHVFLYCIKHYRQVTMSRTPISQSILLYIRKKSLHTSPGLIFISALSPFLSQNYGYLKVNFLEPENLL